MKITLSRSTYEQEPTMYSVLVDEQPVSAAGVK